MNLLMFVTYHLPIVLGSPSGSSMIRAIIRVLICVNFSLYCLCVATELTRLFRGGTWLDPRAPEAHFHVTQLDTKMTIAEMKRFREALQGLRYEVRRRRTQLEREDY